MKSLFPIFFATIISITLSSQEKDNFTILSKAQNNIDHAFIESFKNKSDSYFDTIELELNSLSESNSSTIQFYKKYWLSYLKYKESIFFLKIGNTEKSKRKLSEAITELEGISNKDSEIYALLALEQSFNFQYIPQQEFIIYMKKISENLDKALSLNKGNLRAYYVNANYDFYTPEEYGGGKKTEEYLLRAITLNEKVKNSSFTPSWGKELSYGLLIDFYLKNKNKKLAEKYYKIANNTFPNSIYLKKYLMQIKNL